MKKSVILFWAIALFSAVEADSFSDCSSSSSCTKIFSTSPQLILPGEPVLLEKVSVQSREIDLSFASAFGMVTFNRSGTYKIVWYGEGRSLFHISWILGVSLDGVVILGNSYGNFDRHSTSERFRGSLVLSINAGQVLRFVNASSYPIELTPGRSHSQLPHSSFTLSLTLFEPRYPNLFQ